MSPYETLKVPPDATPEQIKAAWRRKASELHPDRNPDSPQAMADVNDAYALLSDPQRRRLFDETGETGQEPPIEAEAVSALADIFRKALEQDRFGVLEFARLAIADTHRKMREQREAAVQRSERLANKRDKVRVKGEAANLVHNLIDAQIGKAAANVAAIDRMLAVGGAVEKLLESYEEDAPVAPGFVPLPGWHVLGTGFTG